MNKFFNRPVVEIDVSADFSVATILTPNGEIYRKPFKIMHTKNGFEYLVAQIKKRKMIKKYSSPQAILDADKDELIELILTNCRKGLERSEKVYVALHDAAQE